MVGSEFLEWLTWGISSNKSAAAVEAYASDDLVGIIPGCRCTGPWFAGFRFWFRSLFAAGDRGCLAQPGRVPPLRVTWQSPGPSGPDIVVESCLGKHIRVS
jgi:hypothetical protein